MTEHKHSRSHGLAGGSKDESSPRKLHKDWRLWLVIGIMLIAIFTYVLTLDDSVVPLIMRQ